MRLSWVAATCVVVWVQPCLGDEADDKAVALVEKLGGKVKRDEKVPGKPVVEVNLNDTKATDADLKELAKLTNLNRLELGFTKVTDAGMKELAQLKNLKYLYLWSTGVTDAGVKELAPLKDLIALNLGCTQATDASVKGLVKFKNLAELIVYGTKMTAAGANELREALPGCVVVRNSRSCDGP